MNNELKTLFIKKREERRVRAGHLWIFSNEVDTAKSPLKQFSPGEIAEIRTYSGNYLATGYVNPKSLIAARVLETEPNVYIDDQWFYRRLEEALSLREKLFSKPYYRMVFSEGDGLPGLIVDRFGPYLVGQITTAGIEKIRNKIEDILKKLLRPKGVLWRNDTPIRELEGLPLYREAAWGELPNPLEVWEEDLKFLFDPYGGQKTGWYYDQSFNRRKLKTYIRGGERVLELYSYAGAWGIWAAKLGAGSVISVDSSASAVELGRKNADLNRVDNIEFIEGDAGEILKEFYRRGEKFDVVLADPPARRKNRKARENGIKAYHLLVERVFRLLSPGGIAVLSSCSYHLSREEFLQILRRSARKLHLRLRILESSGQGPDHPVHPAMEETSYLKTFFCSLTPKKA